MERRGTNKFSGGRKNTTSCGNPQLGGNLKGTELVPEKRGIWAPHWSTRLLDSTEERQAPKTPGFVNRREVVGRGEEEEEEGRVRERGKRKRRR